MNWLKKSKKTLLFSASGPTLLVFNNCCITNQIPASSLPLISVSVFPPTAIWIIIITLLTLKMQHTQRPPSFLVGKRRGFRFACHVQKLHIKPNSCVFHMCLAFSAHLQATGWPRPLSDVLSGDPSLLHRRPVHLLCLTLSRKDKKIVSLLLKINYWHTLPPAIRNALVLLWLTTTNSIYINIILSLFNPRILKFINYSCQDQQRQFG